MENRPARNYTKLVVVIAVVALVVGSLGYLIISPISKTTIPTSTLSSALTTHSSQTTAPLFNTFSVPLPVDSQSSIYDPANGYVYVSYGDGASGGVSIVSGTTDLANITLDSGPGPLLYDPANHYVYATGVNSGAIAIINGTEIIATIPTNLPSSFLYDPANGFVYVASQARLEYLSD